MSLPIFFNIILLPTYLPRPALTLQSYFDDDEEVINAFLKDFLELFADGQKRKLVLEVNSSNEDLLSIVNDLSDAGVEFV